MGTNMRVNDLADPNRCKGASPKGQCQNVALHDNDYCKLHSGGKDYLPAEQKRGFLLAKSEDKTRLACVSSNLEPVKELRDTIALTHMLIEKKWNKLQEDDDLLMNCGPLNQLILTMERLITSCHRIETNLGELLARNAVLALAKELVAIVIDELEGIEDYEAIIDRITTRLIDTISKADNIPKDQAALPPPQ
jgi:hypothetical protein